MSPERCRCWSMPCWEWELELWERRRGRMMTLEGYRESGGVQGAITKRADPVYAAFSESHQEIVRRIMLRLTRENGAIFVPDGHYPSEVALHNPREGIAACVRYLIFQST